VKGTREQTLEGQEGAVAITVAVSLLLLFGLAAATIDLGNEWQTRRSLVRATDSAALAAAATYAEGGNGCTVAPTYIAGNDADATMDYCNPSLTMSAASGYVTVAASSIVDYAFAPVIGVASGSTSSTTTAEFFTPIAVSGLRPIGLCVDHPVVSAWLAAGSPVDTTVHRITYGKDDNSDCGDADGNWGLISFDGNQSQSLFRQKVENGYEGEVAVGDEEEGFTGAFSNAISSELNGLKGETFAIPVFDLCVGSPQCSGSNASYRISGFLSISLIDFRVTGAQSSRYLDVQLQRLTVAGSCCGDPAGTAVRTVRLCAVDATDLAGCQP
jgi:hypothetical protein